MVIRRLNTLSVNCVDPQQDQDDPKRPLALLLTFYANSTTPAYYSHVHPESSCNKFKSLI